LLFFLACCNAFYSKSNYIEDFTAFVQETKSNCSNYTEEDWITADAQFDIYAVQDYEKFKQDLTSEEKFIIGKLKGSYTLLKLKKGASDFLEETKDVLDQAGGFIEGITDSTNK
jgi:hypothetical protein